MEDLETDEKGAAPAVSVCFATHIRDGETEFFKFENGDVTQKKQIEFDTNSAVLKPDALSIIRDLSTVLKQYPKTFVRIVGYTHAPATPGRDEVLRSVTDETGFKTKANFVQLSQWRAKAVVDQLLLLKIAKKRCTSEGYGTDGLGKRTEVYIGSSHKDCLREQEKHNKELAEERVRVHEEEEKLMQARMAKRSKTFLADVENPET